MSFFFWGGGYIALSIHVILLSSNALVVGIMVLLERLVLRVGILVHLPVRTEERVQVGGRRVLWRHTSQLLVFLLQDKVPG